MASKNLMGKSRTHENPYEVWCLRHETHLSSEDRSWEWRVLKHYQAPEAEAKNPYARVFLSTKGSGTFGGYELGDGYYHDVKLHAVMVEDNRPLPAGFAVAEAAAAEMGCEVV